MSVAGALIHGDEYIELEAVGRRADFWNGSNLGLREFPAKLTPDTLRIHMSEHRSRVDYVAEVSSVLATGARSTGSSMTNLVPVGKFSSTRMEP